MCMNVYTFGLFLWRYWATCLANSVLPKRVGGKKGETEKEREREEQRRREGETGKERRRQREKTERGILLESVGIHVYLFQMIQETETLMDDQYHSNPTLSSLLLKK